MIALTKLLLVAALLTAAGQARKPHVLLVLVDDLGWANLGFRSGGTEPHASTAEEVVTPNVDRLAVKEGLVLERHYVYSYCSPSRSSLQTGRLPVHVAVTNDDPMVRNPDDPVSGYSGIPTKMTGLGEKMKEAGYRTHMTGKWDAGMATFEHTPMGRGYESFFGYFHHANDYYHETLGAKATGIKDVCEEKGFAFADLWNTTGPALGRNGTVYEEELFTENSLRVIDQHDPAEPLFLFHSFHLIHTPLQVPKAYEDMFAFIEQEPRRLYAAMVAYMDVVVGKLVDALKAKGMWEDTLMVFSSDNGGPIYSLPGLMSGGANNIPLRGGKLSDFEGGIRANAFVSGGFLPEARRGKRLHNYVHISDWYATFCALAGVDAHDERAANHNLPGVDGINVWPMVAGETSNQLRTEIWVSRFTLIQGRYKLLTGSDPGIFLPGALPKSLTKSHLVPLNGYWTGWSPLAAVYTLTRYMHCRPGCLYDIHADPNETHDLWRTNRTLGKAMLARLEELNESFFEPNRGTMDPAVCSIFQEKYGGFYGPFVAAQPDQGGHDDAVVMAKT